MVKFSDFDFQEKRFSNLINTSSKKDQEAVRQAYHLAKKSHKGQERDEGVPYVIHCLRVASCLIEELGIKDKNVICAALLHDVVEDTRLQAEEITKEFGHRAGEIVTALTRSKKGETKKNIYERKYQSFLEIMKDDKEIKAVKACDWLDNIRSLPYISKNHPSRAKFKRWFKEAETMYIPLAKTVNASLANKMKKALAKAQES